MNLRQCRETLGLSQPFVAANSKIAFRSYRRCEANEGRITTAQWRLILPVLGNTYLKKQDSIQSHTLRAELLQFLNNPLGINAFTVTPDDSAPTGNGKGEKTHAKREGNNPEHPVAAGSDWSPTGTGCQEVGDNPVGIHEYREREIQPENEESRFDSEHAGSDGEGISAAIRENEHSEIDSHQIGVDRDTASNIINAAEMFRRAIVLESQQEDQPWKQKTQSYGKESASTEPTGSLTALKTTCSNAALKPPSLSNSWETATPSDGISTERGPCEPSKANLSIAPQKSTESETTKANSFPTANSGTCPSNSAWIQPSIESLTARAANPSQALPKSYSSIQKNTSPETIHRLAWLEAQSSRSESLQRLLCSSEGKESDILAAHDALYLFNFTTLNEAEAAARYWRVAGEGKSLTRRIFREAIINAGLVGPIPTNEDELKKSHARLCQIMNRNGGEVKGAERESNHRYQNYNDRWTEMISFLMGAIRREQQGGPRENVEDAFKSTASRWTLLSNIFPAIENELKEIWNRNGNQEKFPSLKRIYQRIPEFFGGANRLEEVDRYERMMLGFQAEFPTQVIGFDATGLDCDVEHAWGDCSSGRGKRWAFAMVDYKSGFKWLVAPHVKSEAAGWSESFDTLIKRLPAAPQFCFADRMSHLFMSLCDLKPGEDILRRPVSTIPLGVYALLMMGVDVRINAAHSPTQKAQVERGIGIIKDHFNGRMAGRACRLERAGKLPLKDANGKKLRRRRFASEGEFQKEITATLNEVNTHPDFRGSGNSSHFLLNEYQPGIEKREPRRLILEWWSKFLELAPYIRVCAPQGSNRFAMYESGVAIGEVETPYSDEARPKTILVVPCGLIEGEDENAVRCFAISSRGNVSVKLVSAKLYKRDAYGDIECKPTIGGYIAAPETLQKKSLAFAQKAADEYERTLPAQIIPEIVKPQRSPISAEPTEIDLEKLLRINEEARKKTGSA